MGKATQFKPGQIANPEGKNQHDDARELSQLIFSNNKPKIYRALLAKLLKGDSKMFTALADRGYGKSPQKLEHTGEDGGAVKVMLIGKEA